MEGEPLDMRFRMRRLCWFGLAAAVCLLAIVAVPYLPSRESVPLDGLEEGFLANQTLTEQRILLTVDPIRFGFHGSFHGMLEGDLEPEVLNVIVNRSFSLTAVTVGGVEYEPDTAWFSMGDPAEFRRFRRPKNVEPPAEANPGYVDLVFYGPGLAATLTDPATPIPLVFGSRSYATPKLTQSNSDIRLHVTIETDPDTEPDEQWIVFGEKAERLGEAGSPYQIEATDTVSPGFAVGPLLVSSINVAGGSVNVGRPRHSSFKEFAFQSAMEQVGALFPDAIVEGLHITLSDNVTREATEASSQKFWLCHLGGTEHELVASLVRAALCHALPQPPLELQALPEIMALLTMHQNEVPMTAAALDELRATTKHVGAFDGWLALTQKYSAELLKQSLSEWVASVQDGTSNKPRLLTEPSVKALFRWLTDNSVDLRLSEHAIDQVGNHFEAVARARYSPMPGAAVTLAPPQIMIVYQDKVDLVPMREENGEFVYRDESLAMRPQRLILDPNERCPDVDRGNNIADFGTQREFAAESGSETSSPLAIVEPAELAVSDDASRLAMLPAFRQDHYGLYVFAVDPSELTIRSTGFFPIEGVVRNLRWVPGRPALFFESESQGKVTHKLLDLEERRVRTFRSEVALSPSGRAILINELRSHGLYRHRVYFLDQRREIPFRNDISGKLSWIRGEDRLLGCEASVCEIFGYDGVLDAKLGYAEVDVRDVQSNQRGLTFITETARGSKLMLLTRENQLVDLYDRSGRIRGYFPSEDSVDFYVFVEQSARDHLVYRVRPNESPKRLYQGKQRPLSFLPSIKGAIAFSASDDRTTQGIRELHFYPYDADEPSIVLCDQVFQDVDPVLASGGRYLYYVRVEEGVDDVPTRYRKRAAYRYDFLTEREESLLPGNLP